MYPSKGETIVSNRISIADLDKAALLAALYNGSKPQGFGFLQFSDESMSVEEAQSILNKGQTYFDYLQGRVMKIDLSGDEVDPWGYDRDNGAGAVQQIVSELRQSGEVNTEMIERRHLQNTHEAALELSQTLYSPDSLDKEGDSVTLTLGVSDEFSRILALILVKVLGEKLSGKKLEEAIRADPHLTPEMTAQLIEVELDAQNVSRRSWYMVKKHPISAAAQPLAGQLVTVVEVDRKQETASVYTADVFLNQSGVAIRLPLSDLTNRDDK